MMYPCIYFSLKIGITIYSILLRQQAVQFFEGTCSLTCPDIKQPSSLTVCYLIYIFLTLIKSYLVT